VSDLKHEAILREVLVKATTIDNLDDDLEALLDQPFGQSLVEALDEESEWLAEVKPNLQINQEIIDNLTADRDRLQQELEALRSQHEFECEYVDQLEQEIISVASDRDRQIAELTTKLESELQRRLEVPQQYVLDPEFSPESLQEYIQEIQAKAELINQLQCQNTALDISQQTLTAELESTQVLLKESTKTINIAEAKLTEVKAQRDQFEEELIKHLSNQAKLHQSLRGLENEYVSDLSRVQELEQQIEELQNQVLRQAAKSAEYEAAIQHWKEQSVRHQHHALQLSGALEKLLADRPVRHLTANTLASVETASVDLLAPATDGDLSMRSPKPKPKVDLPAFLVRR
jgi:chromosome segregation ATPase